MRQSVSFGHVPPEFVLKVSEIALSRTTWQEDDDHNLGGVNLKVYVDCHWSGFERYMLIGQDWTCGFNLRTPEEDSVEENLFCAFTSKLEMFNPHVTGEEGFTRDMTVLKMTASDWIEA
jgi:hypothetical protein